MKVLFPATKFISKSSKTPEQTWTSPKQKKKQFRPNDPTRKPRVGWPQKNNFLSEALV